VTLARSFLHQHQARQGNMPQGRCLTSPDEASSALGLSASRRNEVVAIIGRIPKIVRIIKAKRSIFWYADKIGETFGVYSYDNETYVLKEDRDRENVPIHWIYRDDAVEAEEEA